MKSYKFWLCLLAALIASVACLVFAACVLFNNEGMLSSALIANVDMDESALRGFAKETVDYITGVTIEWSPSVAVPSEAFIKHMAEVRGIVKLLPGLLIALIFLTIICLLLSRPFNRKGWYTGAVIALMPLVALGIWALIDFNGFWLWLHTAFIPDGIFAADEPVMALFPASLFYGYLAPAAALFGAPLLIVWLAPVIFRRRRTD